MSNARKRRQRYARRWEEFTDAATQRMLRADPSLCLVDGILHTRENALLLEKARRLGHFFAQEGN